MIMKRYKLFTLSTGIVLFVSASFLSAPLCLPKPEKGTAVYTFIAPVQEKVIYDPNPEQGISAEGLIPGYGSCDGTVDLGNYSFEMTENNSVGYSGTIQDQDTGEESFLIVCLSFGSTIDRLFAIAAELHFEDVVSGANLTVVGIEEDFVPGTALVRASLFRLGSVAKPENISYYKGDGGIFRLSQGTLEIGEENIGDADLKLLVVSQP